MYRPNESLLGDPTERLGAKLAYGISLSPLVVVRHFTTGTFGEEGRFVTLEKGPFRYGAVVYGLCTILTPLFFARHSFTKF